MSDLADYHLRGTLFWVICVSTTAATVLVTTWESDEEELDGYSEVLRIVGGFSVVLGAVLFGVWVYKTRKAYALRRQDSTIRQELL